jgi:hypothetical protein
LNATDIVQDVKEFIDLHETNEKFNNFIQILRELNSNNYDIKYLFLLSEMLEEHCSTHYNGLGEEKNFVDNLIKLFFRIAQAGIYSEKESLQLIFLCKRFFVILAEFHETLGAVGEAFDYLVLAIRPSYDFNDPGKEIKIDSDLETYQRGIELQVPGTKETLLYYCFIYFKVVFILGHILDEAIHTFLITKDYTRDERLSHQGVKLDDLEILYWCSASVLLAKIPKLAMLFNYSTVLLLASLEFQYPDNIKLNIIETLLIHHRENLSNHQITQLFRSLNSLSCRGIHRVTKKKLLLLKVILLNIHNKGLIKNSLYDLLVEIDNYTKDPLLSLMQRQRQSWIINTLVVSLINALNYKLAFGCAYIWKNYRKNRIDEKNTGDNLVVFIIRNAFPKKCWVFIKHKDNISFKKLDSNISWTDYIAFKNKIESNWVALLEEPDTHIPVIDQRPDVTQDTSEEFERYIKSFYSLDELTNWIESFNDSDKVKVFELSTFNAPLQSILYNLTNKETSMQLTDSTLAEGKFKKILLWFNPDSSLFMSHYELSATIFFLQENGYTSEQIIVKAQDECTKAEFLELYTDGEFDLIWISSHGTVNSNDPRRSQITISSTEYLELHELSNKEIERDTKRLLVLNICQSSSSYIRYNGMDFLGIAQFLTKENQSVVGHHWYTQYLSSAAFGGSLMFYLMMNIGWSKAIGESQRLLSLGTDHLIGKITDTYPNAYDDIELIQRIKNQNSVELNLIANWGSTSIFE